MALSEAICESHFSTGSLVDKNIEAFEQNLTSHRKNNC